MSAVRTKRAQSVATLWSSASMRTNVSLQTALTTVSSPSIGLVQILASHISVPMMECADRISLSVLHPKSAHQDTSNAQITPVSKARPYSANVIVLDVSRLAAFLLYLMLKHQALSKTIYVVQTVKPVQLPLMIVPRRSAACKRAMLSVLIPRVVLMHMSVSSLHKILMISLIVLLAALR